MNNLSNADLNGILAAADAVISAIAGENEDVHPGDTGKMIDLWDDLNDRHATPEIVKAVVTELLAYREAAKNPVGSFHINDQDVEATTDYVKPGEWPIDNGELLVYAAPQIPVIIGWVNEDELPENYPYEKMFPFSKVDIVRMFPVYGPQLPAVPPELTKAKLHEIWDEKLDRGERFNDSFREGYEYCRAAMLAAAPKPEV